MRNILLSLLLTTVAVAPAAAGPRDREDREQQQSSEERQQAKEQRQQAREQRQQSRAERSSVESPRAVQPTGANAFEQRRNVDPAAAQAWRERRQQAVEHRGQVGPSETLRHSDRPVPNVMRSRTQTPVVSAVPRPGTQPARRIERRRTPEVRWSSNWRNDSRYDWRRWRERNRTYYHLGSYYDPYGWGYQPYSIGWRLWPSYYSNRYWINDPWQYRLPYAPPGYRWVRYWDDALLVDTWSGEVVDVIRNFFW